MTAISRILRWLLVVALAPALLLVGPLDRAAAHVPFLEPAGTSDAPAIAGQPFPGAVALPDVVVSRAVYGSLANDAAFDAWSVAVSETSDVPVEILVPKRREYEDFRPTFAIIGAGLATHGSVPPFVARRLGATPDDGVVVVADPAAGPRATFFEPFSLTRYFVGGETSVTLAKGRRYVIVVFAEDGATGEYVLGVGRTESFTAGDAAASVVAVVRIKLGLYGQAPFRAFIAAVAGVLVLIVVLGGVLLWRRRRIRRAKGAGSRI